jgi:hypothetical protein
MKQSILQRLNALQEVLTKVQQALDMIASFSEQLSNSVTWSVPFLSWLAVTVLSIITLVLYMIPLRVIVLLWGINKFTKKLRKPNFIPNNELMDYLSRVPSHIQLDQYREYRNDQTSPTRNTHANNKKKK